jgi:hypothetical protein
MSAQDRSEKEPAKAAKSVAAVYDKHGPDAADMDAFLVSNGVTVERYAFRDLDDLDTDVCEGRVGRVIFARAEDLLAGVFNNEIKLGEWMAVGVRLDFLKESEQERTEIGNKKPVPSVKSSSTKDTGIVPWLACTAAAWERHRVGYRRRQIVAGAILGLIAVAAAFLVVLL